MQRGEVDGYPSAFWNSLKSTEPAWLAHKQIKLLVQFGAEPNPELPNVPFARDIAKSDEDKLLLDAAAAVLAFGRPFMLPPGVPADRVAALREAFLDTYRDPDFLAEANRQQLDVDPVTGEQLQDLLEHTYNAPEAVIDRPKEIYSASNGK